MRLRSGLSAQYFAMAVAVLWLAVFGVLHLTTSFEAYSLFSVAPLAVATVADERRTAIFAAAAVALTVVIGSLQSADADADASYWSRLAVVAIISAMAVVVAAMRCRREERLARMTAIAHATELALLPPLPPQLTGIGIAARYLSATREASVGGDLYEVIPTGHGIRAIIGDVRGNGLEAIQLAGQVLGAFRRSAIATPSMEQVAREVGEAIGPHLGDEDFVTAVLAEIAPADGLTIVNCGHHPPLLRHDGEMKPLTAGEPALPLGLAEEFSAFTAAWSPGDRLLLYTDGLIESRDGDGAFLPQREIATALAAPDCNRALDTLMTAVHRHTGGHANDDIALLLLEHGALPPSSTAEARNSLSVSAPT